MAELIPGVQRILHGGDYNPDQWLATPEVIDQDFDLITKSGCNTFSVGIFAWTTYEPREGEYSFDWLDRIMDRMAEAGCRVILATPSGARPAWMARKYEEVRRIGRNGIREPYGGRHNHCWTSPIYREKVHAINSRLAERYARHPALGMWHLSNEYNGECFCPLCVGQFQRWLEARYGTLDALNQAWWSGFWSHQVVDWEDIEPRDDVLEGMNLDWLRFHNWQIGDFMEHEKVALRAANPEVPITTNFMGLSYALDYRTLAKHVDLVADDQYPAYSPYSEDLSRSAAYTSLKDDIYRRFKPDRPWMLMESCPDAPQWKHPRTLKRPGLHQAEMLQAIGHGAEGTCYFQWRAGRGGMEKLHGAVVDHSGSDSTRVFKDVASYSKLLEDVSEVVGTPPNAAQVAVLYDWEVRWAFHQTNGVANDRDDYVNAVVDHYLPFWKRGIAVDGIGTDDAFEGYRMVVAPLLWSLKPGLADRIRAYIEAGGIWVATYYSFMTDESNRMILGGWPGHGLDEVFQVLNEEVDWVPNGISTELSGDMSLTALEVRALLESTGAEVLAAYSEEYYAGAPAITRASFGAGKAIYIGAKLTPESLDKLYSGFIREAELAPVVAEPLPEGVSVQARGDWRFFQNWTQETKTVGEREIGPFGSLVTRI